MRLVYTSFRYHTNQHFAMKALLDAGHSASFIALCRGPNETYEALEPRILGRWGFFERLRRAASVCPGVEFSDVGGMPPPRAFWREMRRARPDAVVVRDPFSAYGALAVLTAKIMGAKLALYTQTPLRQRRGRLKRAAMTLIPRIAGAAAWITPSTGDPDDPPHSALTYAPFIAPTQTAPDGKRWFAGGAVNVLAVGKYIPRKNHRMFLDAVSRISRRCDIRAAIVGECGTEEHRREFAAVKRYCAQLGLDDIVSVEANLPFDEMQRRYAAHDLFALASRDEWAAVSHLEAMSHSLPVICSDTNGTRGYIRNGENGFVFRSDDLDDLEARMLCLAGDRERLMEMGRRSREFVAAEHSPERYAATIAAIFGAPKGQRS